MGSRVGRRRFGRLLAFIGRLDLRVLRWLRTRGHGRAFESAARRYALAGEHGALWVALALAGAVRDRPRRGRWLRAAALVVASLGVNYLVKLVVRRSRPRLADLPAIGRAPRTKSFPSGHAATAFAGAWAMAALKPAWRLPLLASACAMALTRPYLGVHYPSDALAGALLGSALGRLGARRWR